jgi:hypothetical protein
MKQQLNQFVANYIEYILAGSAIILIAFVIFVGYHTKNLKQHLITTHNATFTITCEEVTLEDIRLLEERICSAPIDAYIDVQIAIEPYTFIWDMDLPPISIGLTSMILSDTNSTDEDTTGVRYNQFLKKGE